MNKYITKLMALLVAGICLCSVRAADFNQDGHHDYLLVNSSTHQLAIWHMNGLSFVSGAYGPTVPAGWTLVGPGDFNGDGYPDLLLINASHQTAIWYLRDGTFLGGVYGPTFINGFVPKAVDDMDGDGRPDILAYNPTTSALWVVLMNNNNIKTTSTATVSKVVGMQTSGIQETDLATSAPQARTSQFVLATIPPHWAVVESANRQIMLINTSTFQTANWAMGFNGSSFSILRAFYGPNQPSGWSIHSLVDFNLDGWNDYLLHGALGKSAAWYLNQNGTLIGGGYGPNIPAGFSFATEGLKTCSYGVSPTAKTVTTSGASFLVNVVTEFGCPWTYHSNTGWIHVGTSRTIYGTGSVFVTVDSGPAASGSLTVANQTVTVTRGDSGILTGHWRGLEGINDGCNTYLTTHDIHIVQTGTNITGTWGPETLPCPCLQQGGNKWVDNGTLTGSFVNGVITIHAVGVTVAACGTSYHVDTTYTGFITPFLNNTSITLSQPGGNQFQMIKQAN